MLQQMKSYQNTLKGKNWMVKAHAFIFFLVHIFAFTWLSRILIYVLELFSSLERKISKLKSENLSSDNQTSLDSQETDASALTEPTITKVH